MHELALYGLVPREDHRRMLQQLVGVTRMQPQPVLELHLVFKAQPPPGLNNIPSAGGSQGVMQQDIQKVKGMLNSSLYYIQVIGEMRSTLKARGVDVEMKNGDEKFSSQHPPIRWHLEFRDTPDPGKQAVSTRLSSKVYIEDGNAIEFMSHFGYEYVSRYLVTGSKFYDQDTTLFLHRVLQLPQVKESATAVENSFMEKIDDLQPLDGSGGYLLQASIEAVDGNNPELKDRATRQLLAVKENLKQAVNLTPGDRLALDTRLPAVSRRI